MRPLVRKKDDGYQLILSFKSNGKWRQRSKQGFESEQEAWAYLPHLVEKVKKSFIVDSEMENLTVKDFIEIFKEHRKSEVAKGTIENIGHALDKLEPIENKKVKDVTYYDLKNIIDNLDGKDSTNQTHLVYINMLFNSAVKPYKIITESPTEDIKYIPKSNKKKKINTITLSQGNSLIEDVKNIKGRYRHREEYYLLTWIYFSMGLRLGEGLGLTVSDFDFKNNSVEINKQWGEDGKFEDLKTSNSYRTAYYSDDLKKAIKKYIGNVINIDQRIFYRLESKNSVGANLRRVYKKLGYNITAHTLRHSYATILIGRGVDVKTVATLIGDTVQTVIKTYIHYDDDMRESAKEKIQSIF